ncbi:hypothetical protein SDC9_134961 [bioreactor metagenome]|uniref:Uncharacterized protein n=1 Tax=bioreactor metagenome TaxID=1076179 RepID=A0A645DF35_9ZZZZ
MSAISSASSSTETRISDRSAAPWSIRSISRPGVATITSTPRDSARRCGSYDMPPATSRDRMPSARASGDSTSATCIASSRVGSRMIACGLRTLPSGSTVSRSRVSSGRVKPSVLPDPVRPRPSTSLPAIASGMEACWIGNGSVMPFWARTATSSAGTPSWAKPLAPVTVEVSTSTSSASCHSMVSSGPSAASSWSRRS